MKTVLDGLELAHPEWLLLAVLPLLALVMRARLAARPSLRIPSLAGALPKSLRVNARWLPAALRVLALIALAIALARPRGGTVHETQTTEGLDIVVSLDTSGSMLAEDMTSSSGRRQNRLDAAKQVVADFVHARKSDRIGLVTFDDASVPRCPPTLDYGVLLDFLEQVELDQDGGGTAIGAGLASAINRLKSSKAATRLIVLVTDGRNNAGRIDPMDAAEIARLTGIRVYAVGVGTKGLADYPMRGPFGGIQYQKVPADVDDETLTAIAERTGGKYYRATDGDELSSIFEEIDRLEKSAIDVERFTRYREYFPPVARTASVLALLAILGAATLWRTFP